MKLALFRKRRLFHAVAFSFTIAIFFAGFQNCTGLSSNVADSETRAQNARLLASIEGCDFNGEALLAGKEVTAFQNSTVPFGQSCISEVRKCAKNQLSGSYNFARCSVGAPADCLFNGKTINHGEAVPAFLSSAVPFGTNCTQQNRVCTNGQLSGTYTFGQCSVNAPAACLFNGSTIAHGANVVGYLSSSVPYGQTCQPQARTCNNGMLSGNHSFASCAVAAPAACLFNGATIAHGQSVPAFSATSVRWGYSCRTVYEDRTCNNGMLSGSNPYGTCAMDEPASCIFNGMTIPHLGSAAAYSTSTVAFGASCASVAESRLCYNGALGGTARFGSCEAESPMACVFNGVTVPHGGNAIAYAASTVPFGSACSNVAESRVCSNGAMTGSAPFGLCTVNGPAACVFDGVTVPHGVAVSAFTASTVGYGLSCNTVVETRVCSNGTLSGSAPFGSCSDRPAASCIFNGVTIPHYGSVVGFAQPTVPAGTSCASIAATRSCYDGSLSNSGDFASCVETPGTEPQSASCPLQGVTIPHGGSITAYSNTGSVDAVAATEVRHCYNGVLSGSYPNVSNPKGGRSK